MKTTLDLPEDLLRAIKIRAVQEDRKLKDEVADLLSRGLAEKSEAADVVQNRVRFPLVRCLHAADPDEEMTPDRLAEVLIEEDAREAAQK
jgi:plasmid stability protein